MAYAENILTRTSDLTFIREAMNEPLLERKEELNLAIQWHDKKDEKSLHKLIRAHIRLVVAAASKFKYYGLPMSDLIQEGNIGLMQAANRFDPEKEVRFSTYAGWWVRACIQDYVLRNWSIVRTGTTTAQKSLFFNLRRLRSKIEQENEGSPLTETDRETIAKELKVPIRDVRMMEGRMAANDQSLNVTLTNDTEEERQNFLADTRPDPEEIASSQQEKKTRSQWLKTAMNILSDREQRIVRERHLREKSLTLEQLGKQLGISKERVRQLEVRAMGKLKSAMAKHLNDNGHNGNCVHC